MISRVRSVERSFTGITSILSSGYLTVINALRMLATTFSSLWAATRIVTGGQSAVSISM